MDTNHNGMSDQDDSQSQSYEDHRNGSEETDLSVNKDESAEERRTVNKQERHHHEHHGNRKYKMFRNNSSANDQPRTSTGPGI
jgi:hypothetical protein